MVKQMDKTADYYEARITELQKEIDYLHGLLREANIEYVAFSNCIKTTDIRHDTNNAVSRYKCCTQGTNA